MNGNDDPENSVILEVFGPGWSEKSYGPPGLLIPCASYLQSIVMIKLLFREGEDMNKILEYGSGKLNMNTINIISDNMDRIMRDIMGLRGAVEN